MQNGLVLNYTKVCEKHLNYLCDNVVREIAYPHFSPLRHIVEVTDLKINIIASNIYLKCVPHVMKYVARTLDSS